MVYMMAKELIFALLVVRAAALAPPVDAGDAATTKPINVPATRPTGVPDVPADFVGFGFETAFLDDYNNDFSSNLINSVANRMSAPPVIRVGGTSGDRLHVDVHQKEERRCVSDEGCPFGSSASFILGPSYFDGFSRFKNAKMTFQIPLGGSVNETNIRDYARLAYKALGSQRTAGIALGNEVNAYEKQASKYVADAQTAEKYVISELKLTGAAQKIFEVGDISDGAIGNPSAWTLTDAFKQGLDKNKVAKYAAEHWYQDHVSTTLQALMNHTAIVQKFQPYGANLAYVKSNTGAAYVLSETGNVLDDSAGIANSFGGGLWSVDFQLFGMARGVARIDGTQRPAATHSMWVPVSGVPKSPGPAVQGPFYAQPFVADVRGKAAHVGVHNLALGDDLAAGYSVYEGSKLARLAFVNLRAWSAGAGQGSSKRGQQTFSIALPKGVAQVKLARLSAAAGADARGFDVDGHNITYAGVQWSYKVDQGKGHGTQQLESLKVANGVAHVTVPDSSAVVVHVS